jgi:hypothetical protein
VKSVVLNCKKLLTHLLRHLISTVENFCFCFLTKLLIGRDWRILLLQLRVLRFVFFQHRMSGSVVSECEEIFTGNRGHNATSIVNQAEAQPNEYPV